MVSDALFVQYEHLTVPQGGNIINPFVCPTLGEMLDT